MRFTFWEIGIYSVICSSLLHSILVHDLWIASIKILCCGYPAINLFLFIGSGCYLKIWDKSVVMTLENRSLIGYETYELMMWYSALYNDLIRFMTVLSNSKIYSCFSFFLCEEMILIPQWFFLLLCTPSHNVNQNKVFKFYIWAPKKTAHPIEVQSIHFLLNS